MKNRSMKSLEFFRKSLWRDYPADDLFDDDIETAYVFLFIDESKREILLAEYPAKPQDFTKWAYANSREIVDAIADRRERGLYREGIRLV